MVPAVIGPVRRRRTPGPRRLETERGDRLADLAGEAGGIEPVDPTQVDDRAMVHEPVAGDAQDAHGHRRAGRDRSARASSIASSTPLPKPPVTTLSSKVTTSRAPRARVHDRRPVERLGEPGVDDPDAPALGGQRVGRRPARDGRSARSPTNSRSSPSRSTSARPTGRTCGSTGSSPKPGVARVVQRERVVLGERGPQQRAQLLLIARRGDDQVGQLPLGGDREHALVARAVLADQPGAVHGEQRPGASFWQTSWTVWSKARCRNVEYRATTGRSPPRARPVAKVTACCSAMPTSKTRSGNAAANFDMPGAGRHAGGDADDAAVGAGQLDELLGEDRRVVGRLLRGRGATVGDAASSAIDSVGIGRRSWPGLVRVGRRGQRSSAAGRRRGS